MHFCVTYPSESGPYLFIISSLGVCMGKLIPARTLGARFAILLHVMSFFSFHDGRWKEILARS